MTPNPEMFNVVEKDGLRLISPSHTAGVANAPWDRDTLIYRSRVETLEGETVSQGFKKFFNLDSGPLDLQVRMSDIVEAVENGGAVATLKLDGSLLIRSVYNGKVMLRTRGSFGYEHLDNAHEMTTFYEKYPRLFETGLYGDISLLFEWTTPNNVIVLKYDQPELTLIGGISHVDGHYISMSSLAEIGELLGVPVVKHFNMNAESWARLYEQMVWDQTIEGYVIRLKGEQVLVKVKCQPYLTKHALKSTLSSEKLADMYFQQGQPTFKGFCEAFASSFDEETLIWALGAISNLYEGVKIMNAIVDALSRKALSRQDLSRKDAAIAGLAEYGQTKKFAAYMQVWEGKPIKTELLKSLLLQNTKQVEIDMFKPVEDSN